MNQLEPSMAGYLRHLSERLVIFVVTVAISVTVVFFAPRLVPGDPLGALSLKLAQVGGNLGGKQLVEEYTRRFGLDKSPGEVIKVSLGAGNAAPQRVGAAPFSFPEGNLTCAVHA